MNFIHSITFRITLWYLAILGMLLAFLGAGVYFALSGVLHRHLDASLKTRTKQLAKFDDIVSIVAGGTFEEEIGEYISFYWHSGEKQSHISHRQREIPADAEQIERAVNGRASFSTVVLSSGARLRVYAAPFNAKRKAGKPEGPSRRGPDTDGDGFVSMAELVTHEERMFDRMDTDGDGAVSRREMEEHESRKKRGRRPRPNDKFDKLDTDYDGIVSLLEYLEDEKNKFWRSDTDGDGRLSQTEIQRDRPGAQGPPAMEVRGSPAGSEAALLVARPTTDIETALELLLRILLIAIPLTLVISGGGGVFLARRALKPVANMTDTALEIEENDLSRRINITTKDELGRLGTTLNQMIERLEKAFGRQKQFTGDASHELRAPLAVIQAESTLALQKVRKAGEYRKCIETISEEADHMSGIINQLLVLARADAGKEHLRFENVELAGFVRETCSDMEILCQEKKLGLALGMVGKSIIKGDKKSLRRLITNLLSNAIRYTPPGGSITVSLRKKAGMAFLTVEDTGIGIPTNDLPFIFERFYRVDKARSRSEGGSGLGLAICKHIAEIHGGTIEVKSEAGKGSAFHVKLPPVESALV